MSETPVRHRLRTLSDRLQICPDCQGDGSVVTECECIECGHLHEVRRDCTRCDGEGDIAVAEPEGA